MFRGGEAAERLAMRCRLSGEGKGRSWKFIKIQKCNIFSTKEKGPCSQLVEAVLLNVPRLLMQLCICLGSCVGDMWVC